LGIFIVPVCTPFPTSLFCEHGEKNYDAALAAVQQIPNIMPVLHKMGSRMSHESEGISHPFSALPESSLKLVQWLLKFPYDVQLVTDATHVLPEVISDKLYRSNGLIGSQRGLIPDYILKVI
jgi:hypothetical protein